MQSYCKRDYDNAYETVQRPQKQLKQEQYSGVVSGDNNELYQNLSNKFGHTTMDKSTTTPNFNNWLQPKDWRKMVNLHQAVSSESETITRSQQQYLKRSKTRWNQDRDRFSPEKDIVKYKKVDFIKLSKWQELNLEEKIESITTITSPITFKNSRTASPRMKTTSVKVPSNVRPGEKFQVLVDDQIVKVRCPLKTKQIITQEETYRSIQITVPVDTEKALEVVEQKRIAMEDVLGGIFSGSSEQLKQLQYENIFELKDKVATLEADNKDKLRQIGKLDTDDQPILKQIKDLEEICLRAHFISNRTPKMSIVNKIQELQYGYDSTDEDLVLLAEAYKKDQDIINEKKWVKGIEVGACTNQGMKVQVSAYTSKEQASMRTKNAIINVYIDRLQYYRLLLVRHLRKCHKVLLEKKTRGEKFLDSERYVQMQKLKQECITRGFLQYASPRDKVSFNLMDPPMNVPLNLYVGECEREWDHIMSILQELLDNGNRYEKRVAQYITKLRGLESEQISKRNELVSMGFIIIRGQDRDLYIPPPANRCFYTKSEAVCVVTSQTVMSSVDRKSLIGGIVEAGYVSSKSTFYDVLRRFENGETILDDCWARGMKWRFEYNSPTPTFTNKCFKMPVCTASVMNATGITSYNDCINNSLSLLTRDTTEDTLSADVAEDTSSIDSTEDTSSIDSTDSSISTSDTGPINSYRIGVSGERLSFLLLEATPVTFHQLRYLEHVNKRRPDLTKPDEIDISIYIGGDSLYKVDDEDTTWKYKDELNESDMEAWKKEKDPDWVEDPVMGNKICRLYLSTTEFPPLEPPKEIVSDKCKWSRRVAPSDPLNLLADSVVGQKDGTRQSKCRTRPHNTFLGNIKYDDNRDLLAELGISSVQTKYYHDLIQAALHDIPEHEESTKEKEEKREAKRKHERNMAMLSRVAKHITTKSKESGSPLVSHVYDKNKYIFQCQHCYKTDQECFTFKVAYDQHGFYIPLLKGEYDEIAFGRAWHNCECPIPEDIKKKLVYDEPLKKARCYCNSCQLYRILGPPYRECSKSKA